ncbi:hypothetical protein [Bosea sp. BIWAKO-01]|uniref:hypothetical protein n=1 Tax=Bosea sp. BIWAKO-01 TaxID=506668 RepID=UPI0008530413|nr:hypothetical protein [Bosea sp. BIWAKO-01]
MPIASYVSAAIAGLVAATVLVSHGSAAEGRFAAYQGAWLADGSACEDVFTSSRSGTVFKSPPDLFVAAFIFSGDRIRTPVATCKIRSVKQVGDRDILSLGCVNSVSTAQTTAIMGKGADGRLKRFYSAADTSGTNYRLCPK